MSQLALKVLEYLKQNRIPVPINVKDIKINYSQSDISNAIIELNNLGYIKLTKTIDQEYPVIVVINRLD